MHACGCGISRGAARDFGYHESMSYWASNPGHSNYVPNFSAPCHSRCPVIILTPPFLQHPGVNSLCTPPPQNLHLEVIGKKRLAESRWEMEKCVQPMPVGLQYLEIHTKRDSWLLYIRVVRRSSQERRRQAGRMWSLCRESGRFFFHIRPLQGETPAENVLSITDSVVVQPTKQLSSFLQPDIHQREPKLDPTCMCLSVHSWYPLLAPLACI